MCDADEPMWTAAIAQTRSLSRLAVGQGQKSSRQCCPIPGSPYHGADRRVGPPTQRARGAEGRATRARLDAPTASLVCYLSFAVCSASLEAFDCHGGCLAAADAQ
jgi:hypothetical protein